MRLREVAPARHERTAAFVTRERGCSYEEVRRPMYRLSQGAHDLAALRKKLGVGLRDAAIRIGVRAVELSGLEHGRLEPEDPDGWSKILEALARG